MSKPRIISDPNPQETYTIITSKPTGSEGDLIETFDPISPDVVENVTGFIVRNAVDIARYKASANEHPEKTEHYARLTRCAIFAAKMRVATAYTENDGKQTIDGITTAINTIDWATVPRVVKPVIMLTDTAGATVAFTFEDWQEINEARITSMNETEASWVAWKHGEPLAEDVVEAVTPFSISAT